MSYRTYHVNKKTGISYVYEGKSTWDKEKKQARNKQVCIGKLDPVTKELILNKRFRSQAPEADPNPEPLPTVVRSSIIGPALMLDEIDKQLGLSTGSPHQGHLT